MSFDPSEILQPDEIRTVVAELRRKARHPAGKLNLTLFRLAACCGLRRKEISLLELRDVLLTGARPVIRIRPEATKASRGEAHGRFVPMYWDKGTLADLAAWVEFRKSSYFSEKGPNQPLVCCVSHAAKLGAKVGGRLKESTLSQRWKNLIQCLGEDRGRQTTLHSGRHSYVSNCLYAGKTLVEVARAVGHRTIITTNRYAHLIETNHEQDIFAMETKHDYTNNFPQPTTRDQLTGQRARGRYPNVGHSQQDREGHGPSRRRN